MKPYDYYEALKTFDSMWPDSLLATEAKVKISDEFINTMPPLALAKTCANTRACVLEIMQQTVIGAINAQTEHAARQREDTKQDKVEADSGSKVDRQERPQPPKKVIKRKGRS